MFMEIKSDIKLREYSKDDYPMLKQWWVAHGAERMHDSMIPPSSVIVEDGNGPAAFAAIYLCNSNHVAFCHGLVTRPDLHLGDTMMILEALQDGIDIIMLSSNHTLLLGTVTGPAMVRGAERIGFHVFGKPAFHIARVVKNITE